MYSVHLPVTVQEQRCAAPAISPAKTGGCRSPGWGVKPRQVDVGMSRYRTPLARRNGLQNALLGRFRRFWLDLTCKERPESRGRCVADPIPGAYRTLFLLGLFLLSPPSAAEDWYPAPTQSGRQHPFVESMQIMMDAMGLNRQGTPSGGSFSWPQGGQGQSFSATPGTGMMSPWLGGRIPGQSQMQQMMGQTPWGSGGSAQTPGDWRNNMNSWARAFQQYLSPGGQLDGTWQGQSGEILMIQGDRYRIYANPDQYTDGLLRIQDNYLWLGNPRTKTVQEYEFATYEGRLALRDSLGQLLLFRRGQ